MSIDYCWLDRSPEDGPRVGLVVQAAYHLDELVPLRDALRARGIRADVLVPLPPRKPMNRFRPGVRRFRELMAATDMPLGARVSERELADVLVGVVVMNDWGLPKSLVAVLRHAGRPTFAWIEGVQDFGDADTGQSRATYTHVDHVFCLGDYGADQIPSVDRTVVGSARLRALWDVAGAETPARRATVNSNFTYGVLTEHRRAWLSSVTSACRSAQMPWVLSRHAAERGVAWPHRASPDPIGELLEESTHLIGRFSTVSYEALVRGVELVYHNPHGEREPTFADARGAFARTENVDELALRLREPPRSRLEVRDAASAFLRYHLRLEPGPAPAELAADVIHSMLG